MKDNLRPKSNGSNVTGDRGWQMLGMLWALLHVPFGLSDPVKGLCTVALSVFQDKPEVGFAGRMSVLDQTPRRARIL